MPCPSWHPAWVATSVTWVRHTSTRMTRVSGARNIWQAPGGNKRQHRHGLSKRVNAWHAADQQQRNTNKVWPVEKPVLRDGGNHRHVGAANHASGNPHHPPSCAPSSPSNSRSHPTLSRWTDPPYILEEQPKKCAGRMEYNEIR